MTRFLLASRDLLDEGILPVVVLGWLGLWAGRWYASATTMGAPSRGALDFSLWWVWVAAGLLSLWLGGRCLAPLSDGSARFLLTGPLSVSRWGLERLAAASLWSATTTALLALPVIVLHPEAVPWALLTTFEGLWLVVLGAAFGTRLPPLLTLLCAGSLWWLGHLIGPVAVMLDRAGYVGVMEVAALLPDLDVLDAHGATVLGHPPSPSRLAAASVWWAGWMTATTGLTVFLLDRRDL